MRVQITSSSAFHHFHAGSRSLTPFLVFNICDELMAGISVYEVMFRSQEREEREKKEHCIVPKVVLEIMGHGGLITVDLDEQMCFQKPETKLWQHTQTGFYGLEAAKLRDLLWSICC